MGQIFLFSGNNPHARGPRIVDSAGNYNINAIKVAIPHASGKVEYLSGSDPRSTEYLNKVHAEQATRGFDPGPVLAGGAVLAQPAPMLNLGPRSVKFKFLTPW